MPGDRRALSTAHRSRRGWAARVPVIVAALVFALSITIGRDLLFQYARLNFPLASTLAAIVGLVLFISILNVFGRSRQTRASDPRGTFLSGFKVTVGPDGVIIHSDQLEAHYRWPAILGLQETDTHIFLYTDGAQAIIIPKRSFPSKEESSRFGIIIRAHTGEER